MLASLLASYCGPPPLPQDLWGRWNLDPVLICALLAMAVFGFAQPLDRRQRRTLAGAVLLAIIIFVSPLCALTVSLFSARVVHHVLLVAVLAPMLASCLRGHGGWTGQFLAPLTALHTVVFWFWHAPDAYVLALTNIPAYWTMQITLLGSACLVWLAIFAAKPSRAISTLVFLTFQMGLLGALLVFASSPLYPPHFTTTSPFGLDALDDQQLAGLIMWVPASIPYLAIGLWLVVKVLHTERAARA